MTEQAFTDEEIQEIYDELNKGNKGEIYTYLYPLVLEYYECNGVSFRKVTLEKVRDRKFKGTILATLLYDDMPYDMQADVDFDVEYNFITVSGSEPIKFQY